MTHDYKRHGKRVSQTVYAVPLCRRAGIVFDAVSVTHPYAPLVTGPSSVRVFDSPRDSKAGAGMEKGYTSRTGRGCSHDRNRPSRGRPATSHKAGPLSRESTLDVDARRVPPADGVAITTGEKFQYSCGLGSAKVRQGPDRSE